MKHSEKDKRLDRIISQIAAGNKNKPVPDFDKWLKEHPNAVNSLKSQVNHRQSTNISNYNQLNHKSFLVRFPWLVYAYRIAALIFIVVCCIACFILDREVSDLRNELSQRDAAIAQNGDSVTINFYLKEHQDFIARQASLNSATEQSMQMIIDYNDIIYYEFLDDQSEFMNPGIIVRGPLTQQEIDSSEVPAISNGHTLTLYEARRTTDFNLVSPSWLYPGYQLDQIRSISERDAMHLLYTNSINSISLFEQPLDGQRGLSHQDFREYAVYNNQGEGGGTILAWRDDSLSYVLIGNVEISLLMDMAQSINATK